MIAAEALLRTAVAAGVQVCFANPGTTELPLVTALDRVPGIRTVLGLFEGVCTGAADGYARMTGRPALTLLHMGPGLANGIANLHNARRAGSPVVNVVGDHATWHLEADAPLTSDLAGLARAASDWVRTNRSAADLPADLADALAAACAPPGQVATLIAPHNHQARPVAGPAAVHALPPRPLPSDEAVRRAAAVLRDEQPVGLLLGGAALDERSLRAAARIASVSGCRLLCETFPARLERGQGLPALDRLPYFPEHALAALGKYQAILLAGAREPVAFFGYEGSPSRLVAPGQKLEVLATLAEDVVAALEALADALGAPAAASVRSVPLPPRPTGPLTPESIGAAVAAMQPEGAIIMDEGATTTGKYFVPSASAPRHSFLTLTGGAIGQGLPCATGAAVACPDRKVFALQADGSALYTLQALWTQAREGLNVTTLLFANRKYRILEIELARTGIKDAGPQTRRLFDLANPTLDWVQLARGMGVPAVRVETAEALVAALEAALAEPGPHLVEVVL